MRKGARARAWTVAEERWLAEHAGRMPKRDICRELRRSPKAVERKAARLRKAGRDVTLAYRDGGGELCPACGRASWLMGDDGICACCRKRAQLAGTMARIAEVWPLLPQEARDRYEAEDAKTGSRAVPRPPAPRIDASMPLRRRQRLREEWLRACEEAEAASLGRECRAAQKRLERMRRKCGEAK